MIDRTAIDRFLAANPSVPPVRISTPERGTLLWKFAQRRRHVGWYRLGEGITIFPNLCTRPGTGYSWPGHISDRTVQGVLAHELGHHVHHSREDAEQIRRNFPRRHAVTGYEPNVDEAFAESFRIFVLNPALLREGRPERYSFLLSLDLRPSDDRDWPKILGAIPAHMARRIPSWIARGQPTQRVLDV